MAELLVLGGERVEATDGETSEVVESQIGFHLIRVDEVHEARIKPLDAVRAEIVTTL